MERARCADELSVGEDAWIRTGKELGLVMTIPGFLFSNRSLRTSWSGLSWARRCVYKTVPGPLPQNASVIPFVDVLVPPGPPLIHI